MVDVPSGHLPLADKQVADADPPTLWPRLERLKGERVGCIFDILEVDENWDRVSDPWLHTVLNVTWQSGVVSSDLE